MLNFLFGFHGRIRRSHYFLGTVGVWVVASIIGAVCFTSLNIDVSDMNDITFNGDAFNGDASPLTAVIFGVLGVVTCWSLLAISVKRWHDVGVTGWFSLLSLPMVTHGAVFLLLCLLPGTTGPNKFGSDPRGRKAPLPYAPTTYEPSPAPAQEPVSAPV